MKKLILLSLVAFAMMSCEKTEVTPEKTTESEETIGLSTAKILGDFQNYRNETLDSIIDKWTGTEWTYKEEWNKIDREDSEIIKEFNADGTFIDKYATVETHSGTWGASSDGSFYFDYTIDKNTNDRDKAYLEGRRFIQVYCDNTYSIVKEGDKKAIDYYKKMDETECGNLITYNVK